MRIPPLLNPLITRSSITQLDSFKTNPGAVVRRAPLRTMTGPPPLVLPVKLSWLSPSIVVPAGIAGNPDVGAMVKTVPLNPGSLLGIWKLIVVERGGELLDRLNAKPSADRRLPE